ncbi:MAG: ribonuclease P protein component [Thiotrichales bacterium]|nr:ribonuclease P protein component [Thiotrichales bacterium]
MNTRTGRFTRQHRLSQPDEFAQAFQSRYRSSDSLFLVLAKRNKEEFARLGLAISKKNVATAIRRNRLKRQVREYFRHNTGVFNGWDIVVVARRACSQADWPRIKKSLNRHWRFLENKTC